MALKKDIILENGIKVTYHRIINIFLVTNKEINILVASYANKNSREADFLDNNIIDTKVYTLEYKEDFNIKSAYNHIKNIEQFKDAKDV